MISRQLTATLAALLMTGGAAGAAVAVNLSAGAETGPTPAGQLAAVEPTTTAPVVPSTIVVDVTVPDLPPVVPPATDDPAGSIVDDASADAPVSERSSSGRSGRASSYDLGADPVPEATPPAPAVRTEPGGGYSDDDRSDDHAEDRDDGTEHEGRDDDD